MKWEFRDVSLGLQKLRDLLLGRKHTHHGRFMPKLSPRSIPPPDVPRGPCYKYSDQYYGYRNVIGSVKPPVVAPIALGKTKSSPINVNPNPLSFSSVPTPGGVWWFDAHCYYKEVRVVPCVPPPSPSSPCSPPSKKTAAIVPKEEKPYCDSVPSMTKEKESSSDYGPCDPCNPKNKKPCNYD